MTAYLLSTLELNLELPSLITMGFYSLYYRQKVVFLQLKMVRNQVKKYDVEVVTYKIDF